MTTGSRWFWICGGLALAACGRETEFRRIERPPEVAIVVPALDQALRIGEDEPVFTGTVADSFDAPSGLTATWAIDDADPVQAPVGADGTVTLDVDFGALALGPHTVRLRAVDSDGDAAEDEVSWTLLGAFEPPLVRITAPGDGTQVTAAEEITFRGEATDNNTLPDDLEFTWISSIDLQLDGAISGDGQSVLFDSTLSAGTHQITLEVEDIDGLVGSDSIEVVVSPDIPPVDAEVGDIVFSEILVNPQVVEDIDGEWIELFNTSSNPIDLDGYVLSDLGIDSYEITETVIVAPGAFVVLCANPDLAENGGIPCDARFLRSELGGAGSMALGNAGDEVVLSRPDGLVIDQVVYTPSWFVAAVAKGVDPDVLDASNNDDESQWCNQVTILPTATEPGTPGMANDPCP